MKILQITYYTFITYLREKQALAMMLLMPLVLILLIGTGLSGVFEAPEMETSEVAFLNSDDGEMSMFFEEFIEIEKISKLLEVTRVASFEEGQKLLEELEVRAFISIDDDYSKLIFKGEEAKINILFLQQDGIGQSMVRNIVGAFNSEGNTINALRMLGAYEVEHLRSNIIMEEPILEGKEGTRAIDYYSITMLVMTVMWGAFYTLEGMSEMKEDPVGKRIKSTPTKPYQTYVGVTLASVIIVFLQGLVLLFFTKYVYGANWGVSIAVPVLMIFVMVLLSSSIGMALGAVCPKISTARNVMNSAIPALTLIAGGYIPIGDLDGILGALQRMSPNFHMQNAFFNYIFEGDAGKIISALVTILLMTVFMLVVTFIAGRRQRHDSV